MMSITQTIIQERLRPSTSITSSVDGQARSTAPNVFRSKLVERIRNIPSTVNQFCQDESVEIFKLISNARREFVSFIKTILLKIHTFLLTASIYATLVVILLQFVMCVIALNSTIIPIGLSFLLVCIFIMACIFVKINVKVPIEQLERKSRSQTKNE